MADDADDEVYCICRRPYHQDEFMIECDKCKDWFHGSCVGIEEHQSNDIENYHCPNCQVEHGPLTLKRRRNWHRHDYSELNDGSKAVQSGTVVFVSKLKQMKFPSADEVMLFPKGSDLTLEWFATHGFDKPMIVEEPKGLKIKIPSPEFSIPDVERYVGSLRELDIIDVSRQDDIKMKMREWVEYHQSRPRQKVLNVISLEFSDTPLSELVEPPEIVRQIDWINLYWPPKVPEEGPQRPRVQKYCLMGTKDSYTDFHVDFGGTSVWYHIVWGEKIFYLIPPTDENLLLYEEWVLSSNQSEIFFGSRVKNCYCIRVLPGNTLFIPTGWIHSVLTPQDSLVFGGNFLHSYNIDLQLRIYGMELRLHTPEKFLHPSYETLCWYVAKQYHKELIDHLDDGSNVPVYLLNGISSLTKTLQNWTLNREVLKNHKWNIPEHIRPSVLISQLQRALKLLSNESNTKGDVSVNDEELMTTNDDASHKSIRLRFSHGQVTRHEKDGNKEMITIKLTLPQAKKRKEHNTKNESDDSPDCSNEDDEVKDDKEYVGIDDAGATIDDKDDKLWRPSSRNTSEKSSPTKQKKLLIKHDERDELYTAEDSRKGRGKIKPRTTKQRLGKILGLDRTGRFIRK